MKLIIDIPEVFYEYCKAQEDTIEIQLAVKNGIPISEAQEIKHREDVIDKLKDAIKAMPRFKVWGVDSSMVNVYGVLELIDKHLAKKPDGPVGTEAVEG